MSTRSSLILTDDNEHWYEETNSPNYKNGEFQGFNVELEICIKNLVEHYIEDERLYMTIKGDTHLAKILHKYLKDVEEYDL